ncbi:FtsX-like permease family protein [bacterium]|nr:FtsX-like permease family protein [bacterium]
MNQWFWPALKRELKASWNKLSLAALSLFLATAALTAVILSDARLQYQTKQQADLLLGGDAEISDVRPLPATLLENIQNSAKIVRKTHLSSFFTMASFAPGARPRLVEALAVDDAFPLVPAMNVVPKLSHEQLRQGGIWLERSLAESFSLQVTQERWSGEPGEKLQQKLVGERKAIRIGKKIYPIVGIVENDQMRDFASFSLGARIYLAREIATKQKFISTQARMRDKLVVQFASHIDAKKGKEWLLDEIKKSPSPQASLKSKDDALANTFKPARSLFLFYDGIGFSMLLLLGLGCAQGIHSYLQRRRSDAKILTLIGAPHQQVALLYIGNIAVIAAVALALGAWCGFSIYEFYLLPKIKSWTPGLTAQLPQAGMVALTFRFAIAVFCLTSALVLPGALFLLQKNHSRTQERNPGFASISPLKNRVSKSVSLVADLIRDFPDIIWLFAAFILSFVISSQIIFNLYLVLILSLAYVLIHFCVRYISSLGLSSRIRLPLFFRLATSEISARPAQSTLSLMLFCLSVCLLGFLWNIRGNIVDQLTNVFSNNTRPNVFVLDAPPEAVKSIGEILRSGRAEHVWSEKITRARLASINGKNQDQWLAQFTSQSEAEQTAQRLFNREQNLTSHESPGSDEEIISGRFWSKESAQAKLTEVSVEQGIAKRLKVDLGDQLTFDVQGVPLKVKVTSLRRVRWQSFRPNFLFILHPSVLEDAPFASLITAAVRESKNRQDVITQLFQQHPGVTAIDAHELTTLVSRLMTTAVDIVRSLSIMLLIGALINTGLSAWTSFTLRSQNFSLYRCLGANNSLIMSACLSEFILLAGLGSTIGLLASLGLSAIVQSTLLNINDQLTTAPWSGISIALGVVVVSIAIGFATSLLILKQAPLRVLRRPG